jgi:hypothetical protein
MRASPEWAIHMAPDSKISGGIVVNSILPGQHRAWHRFSLRKTLM